MTVTVSTPGPADLPRVVEALAAFQVEDGGPPPLHPGDVGWHQKAGPDATAEALRVWERDGVPVVVGLGDDEVLRLAVAPQVGDDEQVAALVADDLEGTGGLRDGASSVELRSGAALRRTLEARGWVDGEPWACFTLDLSHPVPDHGLRLEVVDGAEGELDDVVVHDVVAAHRAAWERSAFSVEALRRMADGPAFRRGRFLVLHDERSPVATACVWSAGSGRPGLIEPLGVDRAHRGRGHGRAVLRACAAALQAMGSTSMRVATPVTQWPAVPLYASAMTRLPDHQDLVRPVRG